MHRPVRRLAETHPPLRKSMSARLALSVCGCLAFPMWVLSFFHKLDNKNNDNMFIIITIDDTKNSN
jgi:hypothetical protein